MIQIDNSLKELQRKINLKQIYRERKERLIALLEVSKKWARKNLLWLKFLKINQMI